MTPDAGLLKALREHAAEERWWYDRTAALAEIRAAVDAALAHRSAPDAGLREALAGLVKAVRSGSLVSDEMSTAFRAATAALAAHRSSEPSLTPTLTGEDR